MASEFQFYFRRKNITQSMETLQTQCLLLRRRDSQCRLLTKLWTEWPRNCSSIPGMRKRFVAFLKNLDLLLWSPNLVISGYLGQFFLEFSGRFMKLTAHHHNSFNEENGRGCASTAPYGFMACAEKNLRFIVDITLNATFMSDLKASKQFSLQM